MIYLARKIAKVPGTEHIPAVALAASRGEERAVLQPGCPNYQGLARLDLRDIHSGGVEAPRINTVIRVIETSGLRWVEGLAS